MKSTLLLFSAFFLFLNSYAQKTIDRKDISTWTGSQWSMVAKLEYSYFLNKDSVEIAEMVNNGGTYKMNRKEAFRYNADGETTNYVEQTLDPNSQTIENHVKISYEWTTENIGGTNVTYNSRVLSFDWNKSSSSWDTSYVEIRTVDSDGNLIAKMTYQGGSTAPYAKFDYNYNSMGNMDTQWVYVWANAQWTPNARILYSYLGSDNPESELTELYFSGSFIPYFKLDYTYTGSGKVASSTTSNWSMVGQQFVPSNRILFTYDTDDDIDFEIRQTYNNGWVDQFKTVYVYQGGSSSFRPVTASFKAYPQPAKDILHLESKEAMIEMELMDANGRVLYTKDLQHRTEGQIDMSQQAAGWYMIRIKLESGAIQTRKILSIAN